MSSTLQHNCEQLARIEHLRAELAYQLKQLMPERILRVNVSIHIQPGQSNLDLAEAARASGWGHGAEGGCYWYDSPRELGMTTIDYRDSEPVATDAHLEAAYEERFELFDE